MSLLLRGKTREKRAEKENEKSTKEENEGREKEDDERKRGGKERERPSVCRFKTPPCVRSKRFRVYWQNARMLNTCGSASSPSPRVPASVSSSTLAPQRRVRLWEWVMILTDQRPCYWNRDTEETRWQLEGGHLPRWWLRPDGHNVDHDDM